MMRTQETAKPTGRHAKPRPRSFVSKISILLSHRPDSEPSRDQDVQQPSSALPAGQTPRAGRHRKQSQQSEEWPRTPAEPQNLIGKMLLYRPPENPTPIPRHKASTPPKLQIPVATEVVKTATEPQPTSNDPRRSFTTRLLSHRPDGTDKWPTPQRSDFKSPFEDRGEQTAAHRGARWGMLATPIPAAAATYLALENLDVPRMISEVHERVPFVGPTIAAFTISALVATIGELRGNAKDERSSDTLSLFERELPLQPVLSAESVAH